MPDHKKNSMKISIKLLFGLILSTLICYTSLAHPGGHYLQQDEANLHHWKLNINNQQVIGNLSMTKNNMVYVEGVNGKIWNIPMELIDSDDMKYVNTEMEKINQWNGVINYATTGIVNTWKLKDILSLISIGLLALLFYTLSVYSKKRNFSPNWSVTFTMLTIICVIGFFISCKKKNPTGDGNNNGGGGSNNGIPKTTTSFIDSAFTPFKPSISTNWDTTYFYVSSTGIPNHNMMVGITSWQQQVPIPQNYSGTNHWSIPLQPVYATTPLSTRTNFMKGAVAIAVNGIPIFNALNNRGEDSYLIGELDNWGGHCGKGDDYHYHAAPLSLSSVAGLKPIAFALDGFAVYGNLEPDGTTMQALDTCHGHIYNNGVYHYHGTTTYPYVVGAMKGKVAIDPTTPAPENQILPQAFAHPIRPATSPLRNAVITEFTAPATMTYNLTYKIGVKFGHVNYNWDNTGHYHFEFIDTAGVTTTANY